MGAHRVVGRGDGARGPGDAGAAAIDIGGAVGVGAGDEAAHAGGHDAHGPPGEINWVYGLIGESDSIEESNLFFRTKGTPPPFLASLINFAVLVLVLVKFGAKPLAGALTKRKDGIMKDIDDATRMRDAAEARLKEYRDRLDKIEHDIARVRSDFREQAERDRERILREAEERRALMKRDAEFLLGQELKQMRIDLTAETVDAATKAAAELVAKRLTAADHDRFAEAFVTQLETSAQSATKGIAS